jgi:hypothetical protein
MVLQLYPSNITTNSRRAPSIHQRSDCESTVRHPTSGGKSNLKSCIVAVVFTCRLPVRFDCSNFAECCCLDGDLLPIDAHVTEFQRSVLSKKVSRPHQTRTVQVPEEREEQCRDHEFLSDHGLRSLLQEFCSPRRYDWCAPQCVRSSRNGTHRFDPRWKIWQHLESVWAPSRTHRRLLVCVDLSARCSGTIMDGYSTCYQGLQQPCALW